MLTMFTKKHLSFFSLSLSRRKSHRLGGSKDVEYRLAQSGDATCSGLDNSDYGSRIMTLKRSGTAERCDFPKWFKEPKHWHSLNGELSYNVHQKYVFASHRPVINRWWFSHVINFVRGGMLLFYSFIIALSLCLIPLASSRHFVSPEDDLKFNRMCVVWHAVESFLFFITAEFRVLWSISLSDARNFRQFRRRQFLSYCTEKPNSVWWMTSKRQGAYQNKHDEDGAATDR